MGLIKPSTLVAETAPLGQSPFPSRMSDKDVTAEGSVGGRYRILYFACAPFIGGAERSLLETLRGLDRQRFEPELIVGCDSDLVHLARSMDVPTRVIPMPRRDL